MDQGCHLVLLVKRGSHSEVGLEGECVGKLDRWRLDTVLDLVIVAKVVVLLVFEDSFDVKSKVAERDLLLIKPLIYLVHCKHYFLKKTRICKLNRQSFPC